MERPSDRTSSVAVALGLLAAAVLAVAAYFLAGTQADQRDTISDRYAERTQISAALLDSLLQVAFSGQAGDYAERFSGDVSRADVDRFVADDDDVWSAVLDRSGRVLASSTGAPAAEVARLGPRSPLVRSALSPLGYGLDDVRGRTVPTAVAFPTPQGPRVLVSAAPLERFTAFIDGTLRPLPGLPGSRAYVLDGGRGVLGATQFRGPRPTPPPALLASLREGPRRSFDGAGGRRIHAATPLQGSSWRVVVSVEESVLYASVDGSGRWLPWIFLALAVAALVAIGLLLRRLLRARGALHGSNAQLEASNHDLARSNADLEQFAYVASHDLSEPLRTVAGFSQLLGQRYRGKLDAEADLYIDHMVGGVDRMQQLIDDLLLFSRVGREPVGDAPVDLDEVLDEVLHAVEPLIRERGAKVTSHDLPVVRGEHGQLRQVLQNLLVNAVKFTAPGVVPEVAVAAVREGAGWRVSVTDNGIGVPPEQRDAIFKMFGRLHSNEEFAGTGIGLALVERIVDRHGGTMQVDAAPGGGSVFSFTLPDRSAASPAAATSSRRTSKVPA